MYSLIIIQKTIPFATESRMLLYPANQHVNESLAKIMSLSYMCVMLSHSLGSGANPGAFIPYVCSSFRSDRKGGKKQLLLWDGTRRAILSIPLSNHQSLKESAHVISPSCNLLGLQLKACADGLHLSASPWTTPCYKNFIQECHDRRHYWMSPVCTALVPDIMRHK